MPLAEKAQQIKDQIKPSAQSVSNALYELGITFDGGQGGVNNEVPLIARLENLKNIIDPELEAYVGGHTLVDYVNNLIRANKAHKDQIQRLENMFVHIDGATLEQKVEILLSKRANA